MFPEKLRSSTPRLHALMGSPGSPPGPTRNSCCGLHRLNRRQFIAATAGATGAFVGSRILPAAFAAKAGEPRPIPGGIDIGGGHIIHILLPGYPGAGMDPDTNDPSVITDFNGHVGLAYVRGVGQRRDLATGRVADADFEVDLRFMKGEYIGLDGRNHHGAFVLI